MIVADPMLRLDPNDEDFAVDEAEESGYINGPLYDKIYGMAEKCAGTYLGQYVTGKIDSLLKLIEDTAKWSLPPKSTNESITTLERPLPWIPFIALILMLRLVRIGLSIAGLFIGNAPLVPSDVVYFIQTRRRKLRAIRITGMKEIGKKEHAQESKQKDGLLSSIKKIVSMAICRPKLNEDSHKIVVSKNSFEEAGCSGVNTTQQNHNSSKNLYIEDEDASLTFGQILDKYGASSNEDDDSDFIPPSDALKDVDSSSSSTSSDTTSDEDKNNEKEIESSENESVQSQCKNNPESNFHNVHITNGNISVESHELSMEGKENGEHLNTKIRKPKIMPKPIKDEPLPLPIQEIKQEPADSDEDANINRVDFENSEDFNKFKPYSPYQQGQSIVELGNDVKGQNNEDINENGKDQQTEKTNGDHQLIQPGSPDLCGAYGYQPTSILKNCQAVNLEKRGHMKAFAENEDFIKGESTNESAAPSKPTKNANYAGKPIKNKFRGKRR